MKIRRTHARWQTGAITTVLVSAGTRACGNTNPITTIMITLGAIERLGAGDTGT
jgi:hypothetical protein